MTQLISTTTKTQKKHNKSYHQACDIRCIKSQNLNVSHLVLQLSLSNPMKPGVCKWIPGSFKRSFNDYPRNFNESSDVGIAIIQSIALQQLNWRNLIFLPHIHELILRMIEYSLWNVIPVCISVIFRISVFLNAENYVLHVNGLVQEWHNSIVNALELHFSCTNSSMYKLHYCKGFITLLSTWGLMHLTQYS